MQKLDWPLVWHRVEWVLNHPRFAGLMIVLVACSFVHDPLVATALFLLFSLEIACRAIIRAHKRKTNPYRDSARQRMEGVLLLLDSVATASLLVSIFQLPISADQGVWARLFRALYLMRTLRFLRYFDLQSAMYSPTYGMFVSLVVLLSFFATDLLLWAVILFFSAELVVRAMLMRSMCFSSREERMAEWLFWWIDLVATVAMVPALAFIPYGGALRMFRLVRLLRPWLVILRNLRAVIREGQYLQEINLVVLLLAVLSIGAGVLGRLFLPDYDYTQDGAINAADHALLAPIWFSFRLFSDPGNIVRFPDRPEVAAFSILALISGLFILSFFIGVGASIVSGLMSRLRNERLNIAGHMVLVGWNKSAPFVVDALRLLNEYFHASLKLVRLVPPDEAKSQGSSEDGVTTRWGEVNDPASLAKVNLSHAQQAIVFAPEGLEQAQFSHAINALMSIRRMHPEIYLTYAMDVDARMRVCSHHHPLQIGWDTTDFYDKPTVVFSRSEVRANLLRNVLIYRDFDQVMHRLLAPERSGESALQVCEYEGGLHWDGETFISAYGRSQPLVQWETTMFQRGAVPIAVVDEKGQAHPLYECDTRSMKVRALLGVALSPMALWAEARWAMESPEPLAAPAQLACAPSILKGELRLLVLGWPGTLPLIIKRLLTHFARVELRLLDNLDGEKLESQRQYLQKRLAEMPGAAERCRVEYIGWDFHEMEALRSHLQWANRVIIAPSLDQRFAGDDLVIATLAQMATILREEGLNELEVFPVVESRSGARALQEELDRFEAGLEIHVVVPEEFFGTFLAHTSFHMYMAESPRAYELQRVLRHAVDDLMGDVGKQDAMGLAALKVDGALPEDASAVFHGMLKRGMIWIGYRTQHARVWYDPWQRHFDRWFPAGRDFRCLRQRQILLNPFAYPLHRRSWTHTRAEIAELIVICADARGVEAALGKKR